MTFEIGDTAASRAFATRNPQFPAALDRLVTAANKCFARDPASKNRLESVCFWLGHRCRQDFFEVVFLAVHGHGAGAVKILRSLYERAVTTAYLIQNPEKIERFVRFAPIQEHRAVEHALKIVTEAQINAVMNTENTVAHIRQRYEEHKAEFKATSCELCGLKTPPSWDIDLASMARKVGWPYDQIYVIACVSPNSLLHATLASAMPPHEERENSDALSALLAGTAAFISVMQAQNSLFGLNLAAELEACGVDLLSAQMRELPAT